MTIKKQKQKISNFVRNQKFLNGANGAKTILYNQKGEKSGEILLPKEIFDVKMNLDLVHQVVVSQTANRRQRIAHVKTRADVRGGGKKPWRQKGTGRARHGSTRSPIWRGGGVTFGPSKEKVFKKKIPQKMRRKALLMILSEKTKNNLLIFLDKLKLEKAKTKLMAEIIRAQDQNLKIQTKKQQKFLIILPKIDNNVILATKNISGSSIVQAKDLNCLDILSYKYLIILEDSIKIIKETFINKKLKIKNQKSKLQVKS